MKFGDLDWRNSEWWPTCSSEVHPLVTQILRYTLDGTIGTRTGCVSSNSIGQGFVPSLPIEWRFGPPSAERGQHPAAWAISDVVSDQDHIADQFSSSKG